MNGVDGDVSSNPNHFNRLIVCDNWFRVDDPFTKKLAAWFETETENCPRVKF